MQRSVSRKWSSGRFWTSRLNLLRYLDPLANVFMPTALRSITSALVLKSGGKHPQGLLVPVGSFILMTGKGGLAVIPIVFAPVALFSRWRFACAWRMEVFVGIWLVSTRCTTTRDRSRVGMLGLPISRTERGPRRNFSWRILPFARRSTRLRCLTRLLEHLRL